MKKLIFIFFILYSSISYSQKLLLDFSSHDFSKEKSEPDETKNFIKNDNYILDFSLGIKFKTQKWINRVELNYFKSQLLTTIGNWRYFIDVNYQQTPDKQLAWRTLDYTVDRYGLKYFRGKKIYSKKRFKILFLPNVQFFYSPKLKHSTRAYTELMYDKERFNYLDYKEFPEEYRISLGLRLAFQYSYKRLNFAFNIDNNVYYAYKTGTTFNTYTCYNKKNEVIKITSNTTNNNTNSLYTNFFRTTFSIGYYFGRDKL